MTTSTAWSEVRPPPDNRLRQAADLLLAVLDGPSAGGAAPTPASPAESLQAALRSTDGRCNAVAGVALVGSRLLVIETADPHDVSRAMATVEANSRAVCAPHGDCGVVALIAVGPLLRLSGVGVHAGVSRVITSPVDLHAAHRDAMDAARVAAAEGHRLVCAERQWALLTRHRLEQELTRHLHAGTPPHRLLTYDEKHGSEFARTVAVWLANAGDTASTARTLRVHPNTLRYRLRRAQEISGLDLGSAEDRVICQLLFRTTPR